MDLIDIYKKCGSLVLEIESLSPVSISVIYLNIIVLSTTCFVEAAD